MEFILEEYHRNITGKELIADLKRVARELGKKTLSTTEYRQHGKYSPTTVWNRFGTWNKAVRAAGLKPVVTRGASVQELFDNIERLWLKKKRQPKASDMKLPGSQFSVTPYQRIFGSWRKALIAFVMYIAAGRVIDMAAYEKIEGKGSGRLRRKRGGRKKISKTMRYTVLHRDNYRCKSCGRSPATHRGVQLQIDHIVPWSKGGSTQIDNLQTLCVECNAGKGDKA